MTVSLEKDLRHLGVRVPGRHEHYDLFDFEAILAPRWWDDASYARYQADDGPYGEFVTELSMDRSGTPLRRRWISFEFDEDATAGSRATRRLIARFDDQLLKLRSDGAEDRATLHEADPIPF